MPQFALLWANHPQITGEPDLLDRVTYADQCAIKLSAASTRSGVDMKSYHGVLSWQKDKPRYAIRAQELANWLATPASRMLSKVVKMKPSEAFDLIKGKRGILFIQNYGGSNRQGDHIDLWNGARMTDRFSWARINLGISWEGRFSDFRKAESIWFWELQ